MRVRSDRTARVGVGGWIEEKSKDESPRTLGELVDGSSSTGTLDRVPGEGVCVYL